VKYRLASPEALALLERHLQDLKALTRVKGFSPILGQSSGTEAVLPLAHPAIELRIPLEGLINFDEERKRLQKEIEKVKADLAFVRNKLGQETFIAKAPPQLVEKEKKREQELLSKQTELEGALKRLPGAT